MTTELNVWVALGYDPIEQAIIVVGFGKTEDEAKGAYQRAASEMPDACVAHEVFPMVCEGLASQDFGGRVLRWMQRCKIPKSQQRGLYKQLIDELVTAFAVES